MAALLLHPGVHRPGSSMNGLLPAARVPERRGSLPHPGVKLIGEEIGTFRPHSALGFLAEFVNSDRAQGAVSDDFAPVLAILIRPSASGGFRVLARPWPSGFHQAPHDGIERAKPVNHIAMRAVAG